MNLSRYLDLSVLFRFRYANRAKNIKNKPRVNEDPKDALLREFQLEIARLKAQINEKGVGVKKEKKKKKKKLNSNVKPVNQIEKVPKELSFILFIMVMR